MDAKSSKSIASPLLFELIFRRNYRDESFVKGSFASFFFSYKLLYKNIRLKIYIFTIYGADALPMHVCKMYVVSEKKKITSVHSVV